MTTRCRAGHDHEGDPGMAPARPRVLQVVDSLDRGGAQKVVVELSGMLGRRGIDVTVLALTDDREHSVRRALEGAGARVVAIPAGSRRGLVDLRRLVRMALFVRRGRFDVVHTHLFYANVLGCLAARAGGAPAVATLHSAGRGPRGHDGLKERLEGLVLRRCAARVVAVGESVAEAQPNKARKGRMVVLRNPVGAGARLGPRERRRLRDEMGGDEGTMLVSVGRLAPEKGVADLVRAMALVRRSHPSAKLALAGTGAGLGELRELVTSLALEESVRLLGWRDDVPRLLAASDVYISGSYWEGLPMAILEAMAAGLPIVASGVGEVPLLLEGRGVVVEAGDVDGLAEALTALLAEADRGQGRGAAARRFVTDHCSVEGWGGRVLGLYASVSPGVSWEGTPESFAPGVPPCAG